MTSPLFHWDAVPLVLGALLGLTAGSRRSAARVMAGLVLLGLAFAGIRVATAGAMPFSALARSFQVVTLALLAGGGLLLWRSRPVLADAPVATRPASDIDAPAFLVHLLAACVAAGAPHLHLFLPALVVSAASGWRWSRPGRWPIVIAPVLLLLCACWYLLARVAGPLPLALAMLGEAPYSAAFELGMAAALLGCAGVLLGLAPFHMMGRGPLTPILGGLLLVRVVAVALPGGLEHWQPVAYPVVVLTAVFAAARRRDDLALVALAGVGLLSSDPTAGWCGLVVLGLATALRGLDWLVGGGRRLSGAGQGLVGTMALAAAAALAPALAGGLSAEAMYTAVTVLLAAVAFARVQGSAVTR
ncbi:MAG: hypothetical protein IPJ95_08445 [Gemmatimonadetes bacterium]|nr:hypothetical protein [Gemmatimonadota bacterium]MBP6670603.1 hypothetical protein [Gemmatimonadales bacterium]MBK7350332.1 hypothetical protein [Gemmatimonadota bacterium]MBK7785475.1 hypothetical protein [Gemmatimonadota bacterium]MBK7923646.1 hypothetical protein [Gemmatimonadota bacterium]